jgi:hypothetical protein
MMGFKGFKGFAAEAAPTGAGRCGFRGLRVFVGAALAAKDLIFKVGNSK